MTLLSQLRRRPWLPGALLLVLAVLLAAPAVPVAGRYGWPAFAGAAAVLLLAFGALERLWQRRPLPRRHRVDRSRFRVVDGGRAKERSPERSNGQANDLTDDGNDKPRWVM